MNLLPNNIPEIPAEPKPTRKILSVVPEPQPLPPELVQQDAEKAKAVAAASGFGQSHESVSKPSKPIARAPAEPVAVDTGRMVRRSDRTALISTRVKPETAKFLRDYANSQDLSFTQLMELIVADFRKAQQV